MGDIEELAWRLAQLTGSELSKRQLALCVGLIQDGVSPDAIVHTIRELPVALRRRRNLKSA